MVECDYTMDTAGFSYHRTSHAVLRCLWAESTNPLMKAVVGRLEVRVRLEACHGRSELRYNCAPQLCGKGVWGGGVHKRWGLPVWRRACCLTHICILVNGQSSCCHLEHSGHSNENHVLEGGGADTPGYRHTGGTDTPGHRHTGVQTHQGTDTPGAQTHQDTDTPGYRHTEVQTHRGTDTHAYTISSPIDAMHLEWNAMNWNVILTTTSHLVQLFLEHSHWSMTECPMDLWNACQWCTCLAPGDNMRAGSPLTCESDARHIPLPNPNCTPSTQLRPLHYTHCLHHQEVVAPRSKCH